MSGQPFGKSRNVELSSIKYISDSIAASWTGVSVVKGFPDITKPEQLPVIAVTLESEFNDLFQIGSRETDDVYVISIEIFAKSNAQRLDLAQFIKDKVLQDWIYYTHANQSGSAETIERVNSGKVTFSQFTQNTKIEFGDDTEFFDRYRHLIQVNVRVKTT